MIALLIGALATAALVGSAGAEGMPPAQPVLGLVKERDVHQAVQAYVLSRIGTQVQADDRVEVTARWQGDVVLDRVGPVEFRVRPLSARPFRGPAVVRVDLLVAGETVRSLTLTVDTRIFRPVLVTSRALRRETALEADMVELRERDVTTLDDGCYTDAAQLEGHQTSRPIGLGEVLTRRHVEPVPVVCRGDEVLLVVESANMQASVRGTALQDGGIGSRIRVKNMDSGKVLSGLIVDPGTVQVGPPADLISSQ